MNKLQNTLFEVIESIVCNPKLHKEIENHKGKVKAINHGAIRYGFLNYIARFSLANDKYLITEEANKLLNDKKLKKDGKLLRGKKSIKNGFTFEHPIPCNVVGDLLVENYESREKLIRILTESNNVVVLTHEQNKVLFEKKLNSKMPEKLHLKNLKSQLFARYSIAGITKPTKTISVYGALAR